MEAILSVQSFLSECNGGFEGACWRACNEKLRYTQTGSQVSFGPVESNVNISSGNTCSCDIFQITNAQFGRSNKSPEVTGSSPNSNPYASVVIRRSRQDGLSITWLGGGIAPFANDDSCSAFYVIESGDPVLGLEATDGATWWAILVGSVMAVLLVVLLCMFCSLIIRRRNARRKQGEWHSAAISRSPRAPHPDPITVTEMTSNHNYPRTNTSDTGREWNYYRSSMVRGVNTNPSTLSRTNSNNSGNIPVAVPVDESGRQIAFV